MQKLLADNQYSSFVATEDQKVLDEFKKAFGNQLKYINQPGWVEFESAIHSGNQYSSKW